MLMDDPYYSRILLGVPGIILILLGFLLVSNQLENAGMVILVVLGVAFFLRGFGLDQKLSPLRLRLPPPDRQIIIVSVSAGIILGILGGYRGIVYAGKFLPEQTRPFWDLSFWASHMPLLLGAFVLRGIDFIILGAVVGLFGGMVSYYMNKDRKFWQNVIVIIILFWMRLIAIEAAGVLIEPEKSLSLWSPLVFYSLASVITTIVSVILVVKRQRRLPFVSE
jgi:uncharacterized membrane protein